MKNKAITSQTYPVTGFIKFQNKIGLYQADYEAWVLDANIYCIYGQKDQKKLEARKDGRFKGKRICPIRKVDVLDVLEWFEKHAMISPGAIQKKLEKMDYLELHASLGACLPVLLYDFDELVAYENPDRNPFTPFDDYLPEGWKYIVVEGFDALVPNEFIYWFSYADKLEHPERY